MITTLENCLKKHFENMKELCGQVFIENGALVFNVLYRYEIELSVLEDRTKLLGWVVHMSEKTWIEKKHLKRMIEIVSHYFGYEVRS